MAQRFYFAWCDAADLLSGPADNVNDEDVFSFEITHAEGDFAALTLEIINPRVGFLNPGRQQWGRLNYEPPGSGGIVTLFFGRLIGIPQDVVSNIVRLDFVARPVDITAQKAALADAMRVSPYYDPLWLQPDKRLDDDTVLEGYAARWHIDRVTHELTASNIILGEDGTINLGTNVFYDSVQTGLRENPFRRIDCTLNASWGQGFAGVIDIAPLIKAAFGGNVVTFTGKALTSSWPNPGTSIGGGWEFYRSEPGIIESNDRVMTPWGEMVNTTVPFFEIAFPRWKLNPICEVAYTADRVRQESIAFSIELDVQPLLTETGEEEPVLFELGTQDVDQPIDPPTTDFPDGVIPIGDPSRNIFFPTDRGIAAVENGMMLARAKMLKAARAVEVRGETTFSAGLAFSCRKSLSFLDDRLPGGGASGKIVEYRLSASGDTGELKAAFTIACCIGTGASLVLEDGEGVYAEDAYAEDGWQAVDGQEILLAGLDLAYTAFDNVTAENGGIDFSNVNAADYCTVNVENTTAVQLPVVESTAWFGIGQAAERLRAVPTRIAVTMRAISGEDLTTQYETTLSPLVCPNGIDLEAS